MIPAKSSVTIRGEFCVQTRPTPCGLAIFGASGDLTGRKLLPAMFNLHRHGLLPEQFYILGAARTPLGDDDFRLKIEDDLVRFIRGVNRGQLDDFLKHCAYVAGDYRDPALYQSIKARLQTLDAEFHNDGHHLFYLAIPPSLYVDVARRLADAGLTRSVGPEAEGSAWTRVVFEKPFGHDLASAMQLDRELHAVLEERQIYRIDHYLGKETVQNILMFRFANAIFEPIWNRRYVDHVQITVAENLGVGHRAGYYEQAGVLRDMFQNHMLQMLSLVAMEPPASFEADRVRDEKVKLLRSLRPFGAEDTATRLVRGQYAAGRLGDQDVPAYRDEKDVAAGSMTETFVAAALHVDNWRWQGVPFYLRSGKRLPLRASEIAIAFKSIPHSMFEPIREEDFNPNVLILNVQPNEGITLKMQAKHPGPKLCIGSLAMDFTYEEVFEEEPPEAYERLLLDAMLGDQTLFVRHDDVEVSWSIITPLLEAWRDSPDALRLEPYTAGSWGPVAADELLRRDGRRWRKPGSE
jgi:glucose-6-phosphate 1-dehydrogenase